MSQNNFIKNLLGLQEENIFFAENPLTTEYIKKRKVNIIRGTITFNPQQCSHCKGLSSSIIKYGFKEVTIKMLSISGFDSYLKLKKQRFFCKTCKKHFIADTKLVQRNCSISYAVKTSISLRLVKLQSIKDIAGIFDVSHTTVSRILKAYKNKYSPKKNILPRVLCFDEFKSVKECRGAMSFIYCNGETGEIIDIVEDRKLESLRIYFEAFSKEARESVKHIVIDMYKPYMILIKEMFPKAKVSIDRFHLVQLINRAFNRTRVLKMNEYRKPDETYYKRLKSSWKLFLKPSTSLTEVRKYHRSFKKYISQKEIVSILLEKDLELKKAYDTFQDIYFGLKNMNLKYFLQSLKKAKSKNSTYLSTSVKTLKKQALRIKNSLKLPYSNGVLEGINNKIKVLKRLSFGYRSFDNFKTRILLINNILKV